MGFRAFLKAVRGKRVRNIHDDDDDDDMLFRMFLP